MISVLIPTKNEQDDLPGCLKSVEWSDDIHVYDSGSTDRTVEIARAANAHVCVRALPNSQESFAGDEAAHKTWALANIPFRHEWILQIDADERVTPELAIGLAHAVRNATNEVAFQIRRRDYLGSSWLKHVQATALYLRLFRAAGIEYTRLINPVSTPQGPIGRVPGFLNHYPFSKGYSRWLERHNSYSTLEARQIHVNRLEKGTFSLEKALVSRNLSERRFHQKELFYRLPARPIVKFLLLYVLKRGFLDGRAGLTYAVLQSMYEYMIVLKCREARRAGSLTLSECGSQTTL